MIRDIAKYLASSLQSLTDNQAGGFITHLAGLVKIDELIADDKKIRRYPIALGDMLYSGALLCETIPFAFPLVPDKSKRMIVFFMANPMSQIQNVTADATRFQGTFFAICWYNSSLFSPTTDLSSKLMAIVVNKLKKLTPTYGKPVAIDTIEVTRIQEDTAAIFRPFTFSDLTSKYLSNPFGAFQIEIQVKATLYETPNCVAPIVAVNPTDCD